METVILIIHVVAAVGLVAIILLQQGKGADMGAAFGSGASSTVFGSQGSASFLTRGTAILAVVFFVTSLTLFYFTTKSVSSTSVTEKSVVETVDSEAPVAEDMPTVPATPAESTETDVPAVPSESSDSDASAAETDVPAAEQTPAVTDTQEEK